jgi:tetratricopeptide (TPR) repeat protein
VLAREPAVFECRRSLRRAQIGKAEAKGGGGFFKKVFSSAGSAPQVAKAQMALGKNPAEAMVIAEQVLDSDPNNSAAHRVIVEAATALAMPQTIVMSLELIVKNSPKDKAAVIHLANALADIGNVKRAELVLAEPLRLLPGDADLAQALKNISARRTLAEGGYNELAKGDGSYRDILRNEQEAVALEQEQRTQKTEDSAERLIAEYEARLVKDPNQPKLLRSLAALYSQRKQFDRALSYYERLKANDQGADAALDQAIAETNVRRFEHQEDQLDVAAPDHAERSAQLNTEKLAFQVADCQKRVEKYPTDLAIRFEMGVLYFKTARISEAIKEFQRARDNPHKRIAAMGYLAQCFAKRKMFDLAADNLQEAIKEKLVFDEEKKDLLYQLGSVLESMNKKAEAIEQFKLIYKVDASYRDVEARVDAYYAGQ